MDPYGDKPMLCIGGVADGKVIAAHGPMMEQPRLKPMPEPIFDPREKTVEEVAQRDRYRRECLTFQGGARIAFWRLDALSTFDAVERVFTNYRPK